jgi:hypothetical protein
MITCQHEWIEQCRIKYRFEPLPDGEHWEDAHYPLPKCLGGIETVRLWARDHAVHGVLQSENLDEVCLDGRAVKKDTSLIKEHYPSYLDLYKKWYRESKARAGRKSCIKRNQEDPDYWGKTLGKYLAENPDQAKDAALKIKEINPDHFTENFRRTIGVLQEDKEAYSEMCRKNLLSRIQNDPEYQSRTFQKLLEKNPNHQVEAAKRRWEVNPDKTQIAGLGNDKWYDPDHPELGEHNVGVLVRKQKKKGYPHGKENRVRVG